VDYANSSAYQTYMLRNNCTQVICYAKKEAGTGERFNHGRQFGLKCAGGQRRIQKGIFKSARYNDAFILFFSFE